MSPTLSPHPLGLLLNLIGEGVLCLFFSFQCFDAVSHLGIHKTSLARTDLCLHSVAHWYDFQQ